MQIDIEPIGDRVIVLPDEVSTQRDSGLMIVESAVEKPQLGEVVAIGSTVNQLRLGQRVIFGRYSGTEINYNDTVLLVFKTEDILAKILN